MLVPAGILYRLKTIYCKPGADTIRRLSNTTGWYKQQIYQICGTAFGLP